MRFDAFSFGSITIDDVGYEHDIVIDHGKIRKRKKKPSKKLRDAYGHTPLSSDEEIPWGCRRLVVGTGAYGGLPVTSEVQSEAERRGVKLMVLPTAEAIDRLNRGIEHTNAILHITC
jgi:hypothetical protein